MMRFPAWLNMDISNLIIRPALCLFVLTLSIESSPAQVPKRLFNAVSGEMHNPKEFTFMERPLAQRLGVYHFGESEGEWDFLLFSDRGSLIVQVWHGEWTKHKFTKAEWWQRTCKTFNNVTLRGNKLFFGNYTAQFADHNDNGATIKALFVFDDIFEDKHFGNDGADVGHHSTGIEEHYAGKEYGQLSVAVAPETYFTGKTREQLKIMRNTIYARYGLAFTPGGEMEAYFRKKDWYNPFLADVSACLTEIEKKNIETIVKLEQKK